MLVVSDRGDRLLLLNYHGLHAAKRCVLPWADPDAGLAPPSVPNQEPEAPVADLQAPARDDSGRSGGGSSSARSVCTVTSIVECPDVVGRCSEEWRSGISQLAVSSSRGDVILIKI